MRTPKLVAVNLLTLLLLALSLNAQKVEKTKTLTPEMVVDLKYASDVAMAPDGQNVAYILEYARNPQDDPGERYSELWVVSTSGDNRQFTYQPATAFSPAWSPDGQKIAFLSKKEPYDDKTQVYVIPYNGGEAKPITDSPTKVRNFRWSPDGKWIAYTATEPKSEAQKQAEKSGQDWEVPDQSYLHHRLWALDLASGKTHQIVESNMSVWEFEWSPDGSTLVIQASPTPKIDDSYMFKKLYTIPHQGGEPTLLTDTEGKLGTMAWSPDGKWLAFLAGIDQSDPQTHGLFVVPAEGGAAQNVLEGYDGTPSWLDWLDDNTIAFAAVEATINTFNSIARDGGTIARLYQDNSGFSSASFSQDRKQFAAARSTVRYPDEVFLGRVGEDELIRLTTSNPELESVRLADQEEIRWQARDGWEISGLLMKPLDYQQGKKYPLVVQIHGGPESAYVDGWNTSYNRWTQLLAARGYVVFMPNYRGSTGRGVAYAKADHRDMAGKEFLDVLDGIDYLIEQGWVDENRVGIGGWSYGGYFSAWAATKHSKHFKVAVMGAGISNWPSFMGTTDIPWEEALVHWDLWCYDEPELCWDRSPLAHVNNANTPTLILHGKDDLRVPASQGWEMYTALRIKEVPTELVIYPREPHGLRERAHQLDVIQRSLEWFERYLKGESGTN